jgi:glutamate synthase domain-containing protein 3
MYGATGGWLFVHGQAGERFGVRNSGGVAVVEGCGDHGCEYMTNGIVLILGPTGRNFAAGMSGGVAFVLDAVVQKVNTDMVVVQDIERTIEKEFLRTILEAHARLTDSELAAELLGSWNQTLARIKKIHPIPKMEDASADEQDDESLEAKYLQRWKDLFETQPIRIRRQTQSLAFV